MKLFIFAIYVFGNINDIGVGIRYNSKDISQSALNERTIEDVINNTGINKLKTGILEKSIYAFFTVGTLCILGISRKRMRKQKIAVKLDSIKQNEI